MAKVGRPLAIETPDEMWELFQSYREWAKSNPFLVQDYVGKDAEMVWREKERPLTLTGFSAWLYDQGVIKDVGHYFSNQNGDYTDFLGIISRIRSVIQGDQIDGGLSNVYNSNLTARLNGLADKQENKVTVEAPLFGDDGENG